MDYKLIYVAILCIICALVSLVSCHQDTKLSPANYNMHKMRSYAYYKRLLEKYFEDKIRSEYKLREANRRNFMATSKYGYAPAPYLVYNRKTGSYFPYYGHKNTDSSFRKSGKKK